MRRLVLSIDEILDRTGEEVDIDLTQLLAEIASYRRQGFEIVLASSVGMHDDSQGGGAASKSSLQSLLEALNRIGLEYDEIFVANPAIGTNGVFLDDKAVTPKEFLAHDYAVIQEMLEEQ